MNLLQEGVGLLGLGGGPLGGVGRLPDDALQVWRNLLGQATASSHQFAGDELSLGRVRSDRLNVLQDVRLQFQARGYGPHRAPLPLPWRVPD